LDVSACQLSTTLVTSSLINCVTTIVMRAPSCRVFSALPTVAKKNQYDVIFVTIVALVGPV
jgi:hypothetical protein